MKSLLLPLFLAALSAVPASAAKREIRWVLAHQNLDFFDEAAANFSRMIGEGTRGELAVKIELAPYNQAAETTESMVVDGKAEMGHSFTETVGSVDPKYWAFEAPYLFRGYRHMEGVIDGALGNRMLGDLRKRGMVGVALTYSGGANIVASKRELRRPEDFKGLKVGVYGDPVNVAWLKSLGAVPVAIGHDLFDIYPMARDGQLDAVVVTWRNFERENLERVFDYGCLAGSSYLVSSTYMNQKFYDSLTPEQQRLVMRASRETARIERAKTIELNESAKRALLAKGVREVHLNEADKQAFVKALRPAYAGAIDGILGKEFVDAIRKERDGEPFGSMSGLATR